MAGDGRFHQVLGIFAQQAGGGAVSRPNDGAAVWIGCMIINVGSRQGGGVGEGRVAACMSEIDRVVGRHGVQAVVHWRVLHTGRRRCEPFVLVPAAPEYPVPVLGGIHRNGHLRHDVLPALCAGQIENLLGAAQAQKVAVAFDEARKR